MVYSLVLGVTLLDLLVVGRVTIDVLGSDLLVWVVAFPVGFLVLVDGEVIDGDSVDVVVGDVDLSVLLDDGEIIVELSLDLAVVEIRVVAAVETVTSLTDVVEAAC